MSKKPVTPKKGDNKNDEIDDTTAYFLREKGRLFYEGKLDLSPPVTAEELRAEMDEMMKPTRVLLNAYDKALKASKGDPKNDEDAHKKAHAAALKAYDAFVKKQGKGLRPK